MLLQLACVCVCVRACMQKPLGDVLKKYELKSSDRGGLQGLQERASK